MSNDAQIPAGLKWVVEPPSGRDMHFLISVGSDAQVSEEIRRQLEDLMELLQRHELGRLEKTDAGLKLGGVYYMPQR